MPERRTAVVSGPSAGRSSAPGADRAWQEQHALAGAAASHQEEPCVLGLELGEIEERVALAEVVVLQVVALELALMCGGHEHDTRPMRTSSARRRAATLAVSTGRPMPGNSGTGVQHRAATARSSGAPGRRARERRRKRRG